MKLKTRMIMLSVIPSVVLGMILFFVSTSRIADSVYNQAYIGMEATALAVRDIFETGNEGEYHMDESGNLWKGSSLNISRATDITDHIKDNTDMEVTVFWKDTRILTSIVNDKGERQINTKASEEVTKRVLKNGETYQDRDVDIFGKKYIVCYIPIYQNGTDSERVGMIFLGTLQQKVYDTVNQVRGQFFFIILDVMAVVAIVAYFSVSRLTKVLKINMENINCISTGQLNIDVEKKILHRKDEIGDLGRSILNLQDKLHTIVGGISGSSENLNTESVQIDEFSANIYQVMGEINQAAQDMAESCSAQAIDVSQANSNVVEMGKLIEDNGAEVGKLGEISKHMKSVSVQAMAQMEELGQIMQNVQEAIRFLSQQTALTNESSEKIHSATELIAGIASQTNLLSLNASIEAARAGEHGKGFSVVATEIQQLAEQSNTAAQEIQTMVNNLNINSDSALERVEDVEVVLGQEEEKIQKAGKVFQAVCEDIDRSTDGMDRIMTKAKKLEEVRVATVDIVQNAAALSEENSANVEEMMASVENIYHKLGDISEKTKGLCTLSREMEESVDVFSI